MSAIAKVIGANALQGEICRARARTMDLVPGGVPKACHRATYNEGATRWEPHPNQLTGNNHQWSRAAGGLVFHAEGFSPVKPKLGNCSYHYSIRDICARAERKRMIITLDTQIFISEDSVQRGTFPIGIVSEQPPHLDLAGN